jgi:hypothetical protein
MREQVARLHAKNLCDRVSQFLGHYAAKPIEYDHMLLGKGSEMSLQDHAKSLMPLLSAKRDLKTDLIIRSSHDGRLDYIPTLHVMLSGSILDDVFTPTRIEYGTILDTGCPNHLLIKKSGITPQTDPLGYLLMVDDRFNRFLKGISESYEVERVKGIAKQKLKLRFEPTAEVVSLGDTTFVGMTVLPNLKGGRHATIKDNKTGIKIKTWKYEFEPVVFEVFVRLAYYVNYMSYPRKTLPPSPKAFNSVLPLLIMSADEGGIQ